MPENQNDMTQWTVWNPSTLREKTTQFNDFVSKVRQQKSMGNVNDSTKSNQDLYLSWMNTNNYDLSMKCNKAIRKTQIADWIKDYLPNVEWFEDIDFSDSYWTVPNTIKAYKAAFPETNEIMKRYANDDSNVNCDPTEFYKEMWWDMTEWEDKLETDLKSVLNNIKNTLVEPFRLTTEWVRTLWNVFQNMQYWLWELLNKPTWWISKEDSKEMNAIINYALDKYTDNWMWWQLTDEEKNQATKDLMDNPELLEKYMWTQNIVNWVTETVLWWTWLTAELWWMWRVPAAINGAMSVWLNIPATGIPMSVMLSPLTLIANGIEYLFDEVPVDGSIADRFWKSLDDDTKELVKFFWAWKVLWELFLKEEPKTWKMTVRPIIKKLSKNLGWLVMEWLDWIKNRESNKIWTTTMLGRQWGGEITNKKQAQSVKNLDSMTNKIVNSRTIVENKDITKAFSQLDRDELKRLAKDKNVDFEDLFKVNEKEVKSGIKNEDTIAETIDKKRWPENDVWSSDDVTVRWWFKWEPEENHPINEFFEKMKIMTKNSSPNLRSALSAWENKYLAWELDAQDLLNFKRWLSKEYIQYKYKNESKDLLVSDEDFNRIYDWLNYLIRQSVESLPEFREIGLWNIMTTLDRRVSPHLNLRWRLVTLMNKVNEQLWQIPSDIVKRKIGNKIKEGTSLWWIFRILADFFTKSKEKMTNALDYQWNLQLHLKEINKLLKEFPDTERWQIIDSMTEYLKRRYAGVKEVYWGKVEWEVVEEPIFDYIDWDAEFNKNPYLEDKVEIVPKESNMIWENPWVWPDLQEPIRVTPEWFAWVGNANIEWYKNPFEWSIQQIYRDVYKKAMENAWFSETQIDTVLDKLETNNYKISQQSLFWEWEIKSWPKSDAKLDLKPIEEELNELEELEKSSKSTETEKSTESIKKKSKKLNQEDIDHLFWDDLTPEHKAKLMKAKRNYRNSWKKSDKK